MILKGELYQRFPGGIGCSLMLLEEQHIDPAGPGLLGASDHRFLSNHGRHAAHLRSIRLVCFPKQISSRSSHAPSLAFCAVPRLSARLLQMFLLHGQPGSELCCWQPHPTQTPAAAAGSLPALGLILANFASHGQQTDPRSHTVTACEGC